MFYNESMPFSYEIDQYDSSRLRRHLSRGESDSSERLEVKALGPNLGQLARSAQVFDPNAYDGDGDGVVQDGTPFERPAVLSNIASIARGLASTTGGYGSYTSRGSWTVGLTNEQVAERAVPSTPAAFVEMMVSQGSTGNLSDSVQEALDMAIFDEEKVAQLREALRNALDERPALRASFDRFGCPPIGVHPNKDKNDESVGYQGVAFGKQVIFITEKTLDKGAMSQWFGRRKFSAKVFSFTTFAPRVKGVDRAFAGESAEDIITHEWGHYLNYLVADIAPEAELRELAGALTQDSWYMSTYYTRVSPQVKRMFDYFDGAMKSGEKVDQPEGVPFVKTVYGTSSPVEFFAESVAAYFSPRASTRKLLNDEATDIVEQMLGIKQVSRSGFASRTGSLKSSTGSTLRNKTPQEIADIVVPKTKAEAIALADAHNALLTDPGGVRYTASEPDTLKIITPKGIDAMDFSPEAVSRMKEMVVEALSNNPEFHEAVQRFGMPPIMMTKSDERLDGAYAIAGVEGFPAITIDSTMREQALAKGWWPNGIYEDEPFIKGTEGFSTSPTSEGFFIHEWAHYLNRLALDVHPDEEMRELARFWWNDTWYLNKYLPRFGRLLRGLGKPKTRIDARYRGADKFGQAVRGHQSVDFTGYPHVKTQYGQSQPAEAFAEAVAAVLSKDVDDKGLVSPEMRKDVLDMLGFSPSVKEIDRAGSSEGRSQGFASKTVTRDSNGVRVIDKSEPFTPLSGSNWLQDATDDEIADAVVPMNMQDAIALTTMNTTYGADPAMYPAEVAKMAQLTEGLIFKTNVVDSQGQSIMEIDVPFDFSPAGRQKAKDMVKRMLSESPEFAWLIRRFGCPPIMMMDEAQLATINDTLELARLSGADMQLPDYLSQSGVGGFSIGTLGITIRPKSTDDLPSGFHTAMSQRKRTGRTITNPDGSTEEEKERWMQNFGISIADVGIHEWAHWFYSTIKGNKQFIGRSAMGDRQSRLDYMFPGAPTADIERMTKEFLDAFDVSGFIPFNTMSGMHLDRIMTNAIKSISRNMQNRTQLEQAFATQRFGVIIQDYLDNVVNAKKWSPTAAKDFADLIAVEFPYLVDDLPPLLAGTYATATRQELWAEAVLLFSSPDSKLKAKYLTPEIEAFIAYAFGLKPDRDPSTPYQKPWSSRSGLASSSRVRRLHAAQDSISERVSDKNDGFASRTVGESSAKMNRETSSTSRFTVGDYDFDITDEDLSTYDWDTAYDQWTTWSGNWRMRHLSSAMMGIEQQPTKGGEESLSTVHEIMRSGELSNAPDHVKDSVRESLINTYKTMEKISTGDTVSDRPLYRGLGSVPDDSEILMAEQGETITFPLSAFTPDRGLATTFADMNAESDKKVILQLKNGAHVASSDYTTQIRDLESDWVEVPIESVTQGEFTVVSKIEKDGYTIVELSHSKAFDPLSGKMVHTNVREGFASSSMRPERRVSDSAIRTLTDNMDFLRNNPPMGKGGKDLDDRWAEQTINKLRSGELTQEDVFDLMNAVIEILSNGFNEDPSQKDNPEGKLLAYQKLVKRLRRLAVGGMSKDDMDDLRREQGIIPTVTNTPKQNPYPGGRFGFGSTTSRETSSTRAEQRIVDIDSQLEELESFNERLSRAISELQATGNWEGEKHNVFLTEGNSPKTYTKEQLESAGWTQRIREDSARASFNRQREIDALKRDRDGLEESKKRLAGEYPETTTLVDELLLDEENVESILARSLEVDSMGWQQRAERFTDPSDPDAVYVVHFGASILEGGQLDPARSRGQVGGGIAGNTRQVNDETARYMVGLRNSARRDVSILEEMKRQIETDGVIDFDAMSRNNPDDSMRAGRARRLLGLTRRDLDYERSTLTLDASRVANIDAQIASENSTLSRLDKVADQLIADDYQYTSTYRASALQDLFGSYGGRYAEGDSTEWGDNARRSTTTGIHIFKVRIGDDAVEQNSVGETHLVGKHTPIASLVVPNTDNYDGTNPASQIWKGWLDLVIEQDISKSTGRSGFSSTTRDTSRNREVSASYTQSIFGKLKALKERLGYGTDFDEKVSKEKLDETIKRTAEQAKVLIDLYFGEDIVLPQRAIDFIHEIAIKDRFFGSDDEKNIAVGLWPIAAILQEAGMGDVWKKNEWGYENLPPNLALEISRQIHIARGNTEMVAKIDEFKNYLKTATPEQLSEDMRAASLAYGKSIEKRVLVRTKKDNIKSFIRGNRRILTQHDEEERKATGIQSTNMMGDGITTSARRKVEGNILGLPFQEGVPDSPEVRELRPTSGYVTTSKTAAARRDKFKKIYGDDIELMYDGPAGEALEASQNGTWKYGDAHFVLRPEVAERTRVFNADTVDLSTKDNPPLQLSSLEDGIFLGGSLNPIGMLYDYKTGDTYPTPSGAFEASSDNGSRVSYKEALVVGTFKPEEVEAIIATPADFRKELGEVPQGRRADSPDSVSLLIDMAQRRDELIQEHGIEVVPNIAHGIFATNDVEMFNPAMTDVWFEKNFGDRGLSKEEIIPDKSTTPYEAYLRILIASEELPVAFEYRGGETSSFPFDSPAVPSGKSEEEKDAWKRDALKKELARVESLKEDKEVRSTGRSGFASRTSIIESSRVIGEDGDASKPSILGRAKEKLKLNDRQVSHINKMTNKMHSIFRSGKIYDEPIHPVIDDRRKELLDSIRVVRAEGGMTMIVAEPNPIFNAYLPVKRDWASIELPPREAVAEVVKKLSSNKGGKRPYSNGIGAFTDHLESIMKEISDLGEGPGKLPYEEGEGNYVSYVQQYYDSLRDPIGSSQLLYGTDGLHDAFGHFGTGRGYDRHGEWANYLAMKDMIDASPLSDEEKDDAHRFWFREYGWLQFGKRGDLEGVDDNLRFMADDYDGPFSDILDIIDSGHNGLDDAPTEDMPSGKSVSDTSASELRQAAKNDVEAQLNTGRSGFASRSSKASAKKITKNFKVNGKPRKAPVDRDELISRAVPQSAADLMRIIEESPYMEGKKSKEEIYELINMMDIDWVAQQKMRLKLERVLMDSPAFEELLNEYDIPLMIITKSGVAKYAGGTGTLYPNSDRWRNIEGEYMTEYGFIAFPARVVDQETVNNAVSDGPLPTDDIIRHELSHTIHAMAMAQSKKARKKYETDIADFIERMEDAIDYAERSGATEFDMRSVTMDPVDDALAGEISRYAQSKRAEYIAELLTHMLPGKRTKYVSLKDEHFKMLSEFLDIPIPRLRELYNKSMDNRAGWL